MSVYMPLYYIPCFIWLVHFGSIPQVALRAARNLARQAESEGRGWEVDWLMVWYTMVNGVVYHG